MAKLNKKIFKNALSGSYGVQAVIAKKLNLSRSTITKFLNKHPNMKILCVQEREKIIDVAENRLFKAANNGDKWAIDKIISTIGKGRGYIETQEQSIEHKGDQIKIIIEEKKPDGDKSSTIPETEPSVQSS